MAITLADARTIVADHLDDDGTRWSSTQIDTGLKAAMAACLRDYVEAGKEALAEEVNASSTSGGVLDLSTYSALKIHSVSVKVGTHYYPVRAVEAEHRDRLDTTARDCYVFLTRDFTLPTTTTHPLVGVGSTSANASQALDHWICARAALYLSVKDNEELAGLRRMADDLKATCLKEPDRPGSRSFAPPARFWTKFLRWYWSPRTGYLHLCRSWRA